MRKKLLLITGISFSSAVLGVLCTFYFIQQLLERPNEQEVTYTKRFTSYVNQSPQNLPLDFRTTAKDVTRSVVNINAFEGSYRSASGSGIIISQDGFIITNNHLTEGYSIFRITLSDKREYEAKVVGQDPTTDLALLKIEAPNLRAIRFGDSDALEVGEWVLAVGNPFNLTSTVTVGIVSAKSRDISILSDQRYSVESFIQTDAVVNPGSSGGALVNARGDLVGINSAIISESGGYEGFSFAIPSNLAAKVINDLKAHGNVKRAVLGVVIQDINDIQAQLLKLERVEGIVIKKITPNNTADKAGLQANDVITGINGVKVRTTPELLEQLARYRPGDYVSIDFIRDGIAIRKEKVELKSLQEVGN